MKVVLFCGGLGTRLREYSETVPKPMIQIGCRPIIWHLMKYYAHFGHTDFILCLGHQGEYIKNYFLNYDESLSNDFVWSKGGRNIQLYNSDIEDWTITFADTGVHANIGGRLLAVKKYLEGEKTFLANYSDGLTDLPLPQYLQHFYDNSKVACFLAVQPSQSFHIVTIGEKSRVESIESVNSAGLWMNGGFFAFKKEIFDYIQDGEELVEEPFRRLIGKDELIAYQYRGFWSCMDTLKDKQMFDERFSSGKTPWAVWTGQSGNAPKQMATRPRSKNGKKTGVKADLEHIADSLPQFSKF